MPELGEIKRGDKLGYAYKYDKYIWAACKGCGEERWVVFKNRSPAFDYCVSCSHKWQRGAKHPSWKGGRYYQGEYALVRLEPDSFFYPMAKKSGYVLEHRLVVAQALNRCLLPWETVHHKEGFAKDDNRYPEVLQLLPNPHKHDALTKMTNYIRKLEKRIVELEGAN